MQLSLEEFIAFCETQPASQEYNHLDGQHCALAQFGKTKLKDDFIEAGYCSIIIKGGGMISFPPDENEHIAFAIRQSITFGQLVTALKEPVHA